MRSIFSRSAALGLLLLLSVAARAAAPRDGGDDRAIGDAFYNRGEFAKAAERFERAIAANPRDGRNYFGLGWARESLGDHRAALEWFEKAAELSPGDPAIRDALISVSLGAGEKAAVIRWAGRQGPVSAATYRCSFELLELRAACSGLFGPLRHRDDYELSYDVAQLVFVLFCLGLLWRAPALLAHFREITRGTWLILAACVLAAFLFLKPLAPNTVSDPNNHGVQRVADVRDDGLYVSLSVLHGNGYSVLVKDLYKRVFDRQLSVFSIGFVVATASSILLFLFAYALFQDERVALFSALLLLLLPAHLRLAASESMFVAVEFYLAATLLMFQLFVSTEDRGWLLLGSLPLFLLMQTRAEFLLLGPVLFGLFFLAFLRREAFLKVSRGKAFWAGALAFAVLFWPWAAWVASFREPRMTQFAFLHFPLRRTFAEYGAPVAFFDLADTPIVYPVLFLAGLIALFPERRRALFFLNAAWLVPACFYMAYLDSTDTYLRTGLAAYPALAVISAVGAESLAKRLEERLPWRHYRSALAGLLVLGLLSKRAFVEHLSGNQVEFRFLQKVDARLPPRSRLVHLAGSDVESAAGTVANTLYLESFLGAPAEKRTFSGIRDYLKSGSAKNSRGDFFYKGGDCYRPGWATAPHAPYEPVAAAPRADAAYEHPLCRKMESSFTLVPIEEEVLGGENDGLPSEALAGESARIGLYEIAGRK